MSNIDLSVMLPTEDSSKVAAMQSLWLELLRINELLGKPQLESESGIREFEAMAKAWVVKFCTIYQKARVTPYIHAMHSHVGQFLRQHGGLLPFTQQGIEKYNDRLTKTYFRWVLVFEYKCMFMYYMGVHFTKQGNQHEVHGGTDSGFAEMQSSRVFFRQWDEDRSKGC